MLSSAIRPQFETNVNTENLWYTTKTNSSSSPGGDLWGLYVRQVKSPPDYTCSLVLYAALCIDQVYHLSDHSDENHEHRLSSKL